MVFLIFNLSTVKAMEFTMQSDYVAKLNGPIENGDTEKFVAFLKRWTPGQLSLSSLGGSVVEAVTMGEIIKNLYLDTSVEHDKHCASACFILFLAGSERKASPSKLMQPGAVEEMASSFKSLGLKSTYLPPGYVGLHRPFLSNLNSISNEQGAVMKSMRNYLQSQMVSSRLTDLMMSRPSNAVYWLDEVDLDELGSYSPEQEEFFIKKCRFDRNYIDKMMAALKNGNTFNAQKIDAQNIKATDCMIEVTATARYAGYAKLRKGWLPSNNLFSY